MLRPDIYSDNFSTLNLTILINYFILYSNTEYTIYVLIKVTREGQEKY